ncbi:unnamed protein product [Rotaria sordida]|uniref:Uncharacterized protein n=1 Tax=Rotaria sordida TaxID=392033 RepID=A0A813T3B5_9BILA|nr:unnamed protein product [Rotaria sordida]
MSQDRHKDNSLNPPFEGSQPSPIEKSTEYMPSPPEPGSGNNLNEVLLQSPSALVEHHGRKIVAKTLDDKEDNYEWRDLTGLDNKAIRRVFIRKVYIILMIQLLISFGLITLCNFIPSIGKYVRSPNGKRFYWASYIVFLVTYFVLICSKSAVRKFPLNIILLTVMTLSMSYMLGMISAYYKTESVFIAIGITAFVCFGVTLFSFQTKYDFTSCFGVLFAMSLAFLAFGIICIFTYSRIMYTIYAGVGAVFFSIFLAVDTQLIIGGKRYEISAEDHIFASLMLYIDIVNIFLSFLSVSGSRNTGTSSQPNVPITI